MTAEVFLHDRVLEAETRNLSRGGVCFQCEPLFKEGETVAATLYLTVDGIEDAATQPLKVTTRIEWISDAEGGKALTGGSFVNLDQSNQRLLDRFLKALGD